MGRRSHTGEISRGALLPAARKLLNLSPSPGPVIQPSRTCHTDEPCHNSIPHSVTRPRAPDGYAHPFPPPQAFPKLGGGQYGEVQHIHTLPD
jgi:hypothetical protein